MIVDCLYGKTTLSVDVPSSNLLGVLEPKEDFAYGVRKKSIEEQVRIVREAIARPINHKLLSVLTKDAKKILIITSDNTRPQPSKITLPVIISEFMKSSAQYEITILIATGLHRKMTEEEIVERFGISLWESCHIVNHCADDESSLNEYGDIVVDGVPTGNKLWLNKLIRENDFCMAEGFIEPHFFAGYSGGRKSILPGVAGSSTILNNHCSKNLKSPHASIANLKDNPIHEEALAAMAMSGVDYIVNVALNKDKEIVAAFAGHYCDAHLDGCKVVEKSMSVDASKADIVITSNNGYPLDRNFYQVVKGMDIAQKVLKENGIIIICAECIDGVGHKGFNDFIMKAKSIVELESMANSDDTVVDQWQVYMLAKILKNHRVILVSEGIDKVTAKGLFVEKIKTLDAALERALQIKGFGASVNVIPEGPVVMPKTRKDNVV